MVVEVVVSRPAADDLDQIHTYIAADSPRAAARVVEQIRDKCLSLSEMPNRGAQVRPGLRRLVIGKYLIFYRLKTDGGGAVSEVQIARIVHGARDHMP